MRTLCRFVCPNALFAILIPVRRFVPSSYPCCQSDAGRAGDHQIAAGRSEFGATAPLFAALQVSAFHIACHCTDMHDSCRSRLVGDGHDAFLVYFLKTANDQQQIQVFDGTVVPHLSLLLFGTSEIQAHARKGQEKMKRSTRKERALRVHVQGWVEMDLSELHLAYVRRVQKEIEELLQYKVQQRSKGKDGDDDCEAKQQLLSSMVSILLQSEGEL